MGSIVLQSFFNSMTNLFLKRIKKLIVHKNEMVDFLEEGINNFSFPLNIAK